MYGCKIWTIKEVELQTTDAFELWCWRRLLRVPWTARRSNQSIPKEISPGIPLEGMMLKLKLQYFGHLMGRTESSSVGKDPDARNYWGQEEKGTTEDKMVGRHHWLDGHEFEQAPRIGDGQGSLACCSPCGRKELDTTVGLNWTENMCFNYTALPLPMLLPLRQLNWLMNRMNYCPFAISQPWWHGTQSFIISYCASKSLMWKPFSFIFCFYTGLNLYSECTESVLGFSFQSLLYSFFIFLKATRETIYMFKNISDDGKKI